MKELVTAMPYESIKGSSDRLFETRNRTYSSDNDVSSTVCVENEVIENDTSSVAEKSPISDAVKDFEKVDANDGFLLELNEVADNVSKKETVCDSRNGDTSLKTDEILDSDHRNTFVPSINKIRGGRSDVLEQADQNSSTSLPADVSSFSPPEVNKCNRGITTKQDPPNNVLDDDCVFIRTESSKSSSASEFFNNEKQIVNPKVVDPVVTCHETTSKLPSPIPIEKESKTMAVVQPSSSQTETCFVKKRFTRSSLTKPNDSVIVSSNSTKNAVSSSKKRKKVPKNGLDSSSGYSCHLCEASFQENESLEEHMIQHRKNNLIEEKAPNRSKRTKPKLYSCDICKKELSTSQSLQQHILIHKNVKPFVCHVCHKDFRHLSNYRMHLQKHEAEQRHSDEMQQTDDPEDKGVARVDSGRPGVLVKENSQHREVDAVRSTSRRLRSATSSSANVTEKTTEPFYSTKETPSCQPQLSFDQPPAKIKKNSNSSTSSAVIIKRKVASPRLNSEEESKAVKSYKNVESVTMNTSKLVVKLDNLDTGVLKRKLLTPNISIGQPSKKSRVRLSSIAEKYNIKIDEIENIPVDGDPRHIDSPEQIVDNLLREYLNENHAIASNSAYPSYDPLSDNELFALLNDDDGDTSAIISADAAIDSQILQPKVSEVDAVKIATKQSNVIFVKTPPNYEMSSFEDETLNDDELDAFDTAFQKLVARRLTLLQKRAVENGGKVGSRYLLGPLFWCKALRRVQKHMSAVAGSSANADLACNDRVDESHIDDSLKMCADGKFEIPFEGQETNDPIKLQSRAESKFECLMKRAKMLKNLKALDLIGPLFWRRTLQLAGIHRGEDLRIHTNVSVPTLEGVEFVGDDGPCDFGAKLVDAEQHETSQSAALDIALNSGVQQNNDELLSDVMSPLKASDVGADDLSKLPDQVISSATFTKQQSLDAITKNSLNDIFSAKTDSSLFESQENESVEIIDLSPSDTYDENVFANPENSVVSTLDNHSQAELPDSTNNMLNKESVAVEDDGLCGKLDANYSGSIILNVDYGSSLQLVPMNNDQMAIPEVEQKFMLVSDENGTLQYVVNVTNENYSNVEFFGDSGFGEQIAYAIQFDSNNSTAVQFAQDDSGIQLLSDSGLKEAFQVDSRAMTYFASNTGAPADVSDHFGKELSDFLNLDYANLLKNGTADQPSL